MPVDPLCMLCVWLSRTMPKTCSAFPWGIPDDIWEGKVSHEEPYEGDNGIVFKLAGSSID
jgi:hypothetical protein